MFGLFSKNNTEKHVRLCENHIYVLQPSVITNKITEDEFSLILKELTDSKLDGKDVDVFIERTLPRVLKIDKYGIELIHHLSLEIEKLENKKL